RGNITGRQWDFGDGNTSSEANPAHTYESAGVFTVKLTVTGPGGSHTRSVDEYIVVMGSGGGNTGEGGHSIYLPIGYD
ncbi:MAG: PKD domain-containing protein, partial [Caldilineaceae bacterium]|nr:PKD domain-containing protein [Caldilineaceae bacterium]